MEAILRRFTVRGRIRGLYSSTAGSQQPRYVADMQVELWHKAVMEVIFLGRGVTKSDGEYIIVFEVESPSPIIVNGQIHDVFITVSYRGEILIGNIEPEGGSFD